LVNRKEKWFTIKVLSMRIETNHHLDEEEIEKYSLGDITEEESSRFEEHLLICESCQDRVTESDSYVGAMQDAARSRRSSLRTGRHRWLGHRMNPPLVAAASVLLLAVGLWRVNGPARNRVTVEPAFALNLAATRGNGIEAKAPAGRPLTLQLDLAGLPPEPSFRLEMVDAVGKGVWQGAVVSRDSKAVASVPQIAGGLYFLRAYAPSGKLLREYGLEVKSH
jgi:hypothetical protein